MFTRTGFVCLWSFALFACGIGDNNNADNSPLAIVKSYPLLDQDKVGIAETIWVQLNKDLDPTSVTDENIHLMPGDSNMDHDLNIDEVDPDDKLDIISGFVDYDASNRILYFTPKTHMHNGTTYHIRVHDVRYANNTPLEDGTEELVFSFTTLHNHEVRRETYSSKSPHKLSTYNELTYVDNLLSGKKELKESRRYDAEGNLTLITRYSDFLPGSPTKATLVYLKPDGEIIFYQKDILINGQLYAHATFSDPGENLVWGDADDLVSKWSGHDHDHGKHQITRTYSAIGDGAPWSDDEAIRAQNFELKYVALMEHNPGAIAQGTGVFPHRYIFYSDLGNGEIDVDPNGDPSPVDDIVSSWYKRDYDNNGRRLRSWNMRGTLERPSGHETNATIFTDANQASGMSYYEYDQYGHLTRITSFADPGADNDWLTYTDNKISSYYEYQYDNFNLVSRSIYALQGDNTPVLLSVNIYDAIP